MLYELIGKCSLRTAVRSDLYTIADYRREFNNGYCEKVDILMLNDEESMQLTGKDNLEEISQDFLKIGPKIVIIKKGGEGSLIAHNNTISYVSVVPNTPVYDPTGAGDSFAGGVLGYISNYGIDDPVKAVIHGSAVASYTVSGFGLENLCKLDKDDLNKKINQISIK